MASKIKGITIEIGGDTTKLDKALSDVNRKTKDLNSELKGVNNLLKMDPSNVNLLRQKQELLNQSIANTKEKLTTLQNAQVQVQEQFDKGEITAEQYREFQREIIATENKMKSLTQELKDFGTVGTQQLKNVGESLQNVGDDIESAGKKMLGTSAVITTLGTAAVVTGSNFDASMKQVAATMGITVDEIEKGSKSYEILESAAKECGESTKYSASEAADALNYLALAGYDAEKSAELLPKVLNLAAAGNLDLATATDMVTDGMAALGIETNEINKYIDEMAKTSQKSNTSVAQLGEATLTCAGTVKMSGMSLETMNAELGILANNGIKGAEGGTHLRNIILSLISPTDSASEQLKKLGINILDSQGNVRDLNDIMSEFNSKLNGLSDGKKTEIISSIFNKTDISAVNALIKGSGEEFSNLKTHLTDCDGAAQDMADTMNSSLSGKMTLLKSQLEGVAIQISEILMPVLEKIIGKVSELLKWFSNLNGTTKTIIVVIAGLVAVLSPILIFVGKLIGSIGQIMTYGPKIISGLSGITKIVGTVKSGISALWTVITMNPITMIIAAIVALIAIFVTLWNNCESFRNFWIGLWESITQFVSDSVENIKSFFNSVIEFIQTNWQGILLFILNPFLGAFKLIYDNCEEFRIFIDGILETIKQKFSDAFNGIKDTIANIWNGILNLFNTGGKIFDGIKDGIANVFKTIVNGMISGINKVIEYPFRKVNGFLNDIRNTTIPVINVKPFSGLWGNNPLPIPSIPTFRTGGSMIGEGQSIFSEAGSPELMTLVNGKAIVRPLTERDRSQVLNNNNSSEYFQLKIENFYNNRQEDVQSLAEELEFYRRKYEKARG